MADERQTPEQLFFAFLHDLQEQYDFEETFEQALPKAIDCGFSLQLIHTPTTDYVSLCHYKGHSIVSRATECGVRAAAEGLLGLPIALGCEGPPAHLVTEPEPEPAPAPAPTAAPPTAPAAPPAPTAAPRASARPVSASEFAAALVARVAPEFATPPAAPTTAPAAPASSQPEPSPAAPTPPPAPTAASEPATFDLEEDLLEATPADPDPEADPSTSTAPLSADQKATIVAMLRELPNAKSRAAIVAFRKAFNIPSSITKPSDAITEVRHLHFLKRLVDEAEGIPAP